ncbi:hypothetical protein MA16_Dca019483 [Dendrobium catenatum]|uniref:Uncharacterized protein n=1 Tax=Dendrobium catenatum TaxID=906689 RepID=A0A2I0XJD4_9ASPA|nr:hypothetical protein MA16_Dca027925 [Dendrobium catenatum]PKU88033.1 hypothetical protein MA16_Dca019483 [Dendrobium catenatum]
MLLTVADEGDEVPLTDSGEYDDLCLEFRVSLSRTRHVALHGDFGAVGEDSFVHFTEPAGADDEILIEIVRHKDDFRIRYLEVEIKPKGSRALWCSIGCGFA